VINNTGSPIASTTMTAGPNQEGKPKPGREAQKRGERLGELEDDPGTDHIGTQNLPDDMATTLGDRPPRVRPGQLLKQPFRSRIPRLRVLAQQPEHQPFHVVRQTRAELAWRLRVFAPYRVDDRAVLAASERTLAGEHLVHHHAERPQV
jgi:hypothetical protein